MVSSCCGICRSCSVCRKRMKASIPSFITKNCYYLFLGTFLIISGTISLILWPTIFDFILNSELTLRPESRAFKIWRTVPFPTYLDFYFFNWTNPLDINNLSIKPSFQQVGPYSFREKKRKVDYIWNDNNTVSYKIKKEWFFVPERSKGALTDNINTLNPVTGTVAYQAKYWNYLVKKSISLTLGQIAPTMNITRTVGQLLFEGYEDPFITMARNFPFLAGVKIPNVDRFGWFYGRNGSSDFDGEFNMATGLGPETFGELLNWKFKKHSGFFPGECGKVVGSAGDFFPQRLKKDFLKMFSADLCKTMTLEFENETDIFGIKGYKYVGGDLMMDNGSKVPENKCSCLGACQPSGTLNVSTCRYGSPAFVSFPHFYHADPFYRQNIHGVNPQKDKHQFYMVLEPRTGIPLEVAARIQLNILLEPDKDIGLYQDAPRMFFPVLWFEQKVTIYPDLIQAVKQLLNLTTAGRISSGVVVGVGALLLLFVFLTLLPSIRKKMDNTFKPKQQQFFREEIPLNDKKSNESSSKDDISNKPKKTRSLV